MLPNTIPSLAVQYRQNAARLHRCVEALSRWEEWHCAQAMTAALRPAVARPPLSQPALVELAQMLTNRLVELDTALREALAGRRN
jgi:hypothetical protein